MRTISIILLNFITFGLLYPQDVQLTVDAPSVVALGEQFRITWTANTRGGDFAAPEFKDFYLLSGPQTSFNSSTQIINGKVTSTISNSYSYYLQANKKGKFTIPPGKFTMHKDEYLSDPVEIEVVDEGQNVTEQSGNETGIQQNDQQAAKASDLFVRLIPNRKDVYIGEHIVVSLKIYSRINLSGIQEVNYPDFQSFLKEDIETPPLRSLERENVNGAIYGTGILQRFLLYPQKTGTITIEPASLTVLLQQRSKSNDPFFGDFFSTFSTVPKVIATLPVGINIKPLPPGAPEGFRGAVGSFSLSSSVNTDTVNVNEAITYRIVLKGNGNLKLTQAPELKLPPDIEIYEPEISSELKTSVSGTSGSRVFEYVLIPRFHGQYTIPPVEYSYFDPESGQYRTLATEEHVIVAVKTGDEEDGAQVYGGVTKESVRFLGRDIRFILTGKPGFRKSHNILIKNNLFLYTYAGLLLIFLLIVILRREQIKRNSDIAKVRNRKAAGVASKRLRNAAVCLNNADTEGFYAELLKAVWGYISDKFNIPVSELSSDKLFNLLTQKKFDDDLIGDLKEVINKCEYSRYSPDSDISTADEIYRKAEKSIKKLENR